MIKIICEKCGTEDIEFTGYARWNVHTQDFEWEIGETYCNHCKDIVPVEEVLIKKRKRKNEDTSN